MEPVVYPVPGLINESAVIIPEAAVYCNCAGTPPDGGAEAVTTKLVPLGKPDVLAKAEV